MTRMVGLIVLQALALASFTTPAPVFSANAPVGVTRIDITRHESFADGQSFGSAGAYEKLVGTVYLEADPSDPHNAGITDVDKVPRNAHGMVEYSADLYILKPVDLSRGNHKIFYQVINRGNKGILNTFDDAPGSNDPSTAADAGNGYLLQQGYALVFLGWESDVLPGNGRMGIALPIATDNGQPITGLLTERYDVSHQIPMTGVASLPLSGSASSDSYPTASLDTASATLSVRDYSDSPEQIVPGDRWAFATCDMDPQTGQAVNIQSSSKDICVFDGFSPNQLYQLTYMARDPKPLALGFAVTRDVLSYLRGNQADNPLGAGISEVYCWGPSQDGRYLRSFMYGGFNEDVQGRKVCDGVLVQLAGAQGLDLESRFTNIDNASQWGALGVYPRDLFPFGYGVTTDPVSGQTDGILKRPASDPLVIQMDTENEFFQSYASLVTHDGLGHPLQLPDTVRYYFMSDAQHTSGSPSVKSICDQPTDPLNYNPFMRAMFSALDQWATKGTPPPPSQYPRADDDTAVSPQVWSDLYPHVPGIQLAAPNALSVREYGTGVTPLGGIISNSPGVPTEGSNYVVLVPRPTPDGLDVAGLRRPDDVQTPLATLNGWGVRGAGFRPGELCGLNGQNIPFAATAAVRQATGDPRLSIEERYATHADYVSQVSRATQEMQNNGYLLADDAARIIADANARQVP